SLHGHYPLQRYYAPLRLPLRSAAALCIRLRRSGYDPDRAGLSGSHALVRGVPSVTTPGGPIAAYIDSSRSASASPSPEGWPLPAARNEATSGRGDYGPPLRSPGAPMTTSLSAPPGTLHVSSIVHMASSFHLARGHELTDAPQERGGTRRWKKGESGCQSSSARPS